MHPMRKAEPTTRSRILSAAQAEFLAKGYRDASLRQIVKAAGVTTGAFYGYFDSKAALFDALVQEQYDAFMGSYSRALDEFQRLEPRQQPVQMGQITGSCIEWQVDYIYRHFDAFKLLLCRSEGTRYEHMLHELVEAEVQATHDFLAVLRALGQDAPELDPQLEHILVSGMFTAFFEMVVHDMPHEKARAYVRELRAFYTAGWKEIMGL